MEPTFQSLIPRERNERLINNMKKQAQLSAYNLLCLLNKQNEKKWVNNVYVGHQVATSESLTAGLITATLVDIPFAGYLKYGCFGVYDTDAKRTFIGVKNEDVYTHKCAKEMAIGTLKNSNATISIAVSGNAMPVNEDYKRLSETFISIAGYKDDNTIIYTTKSVNSCMDATDTEFKKMCVSWFTTININKKRYNDRRLTALISQCIRYDIVRTALDLAHQFIKENNLVVPSFIEERKNKNKDKVLPNDKYPSSISEECVEIDGGSCENSNRSKRKNVESDVYNITSFYKPNIRGITGIREKRGRSLSRPSVVNSNNKSGIWSKAYDETLWNSPKMNKTKSIPKSKTSWAPLRRTLKR
jgi:nicotinamide mononucleotide (NMN) deamidase PncC